VGPRRASGGEEHHLAGERVAAELGHARSVGAPDGGTVTGVGCVSP
jgi:hypothetical protein